MGLVLLLFAAFGIYEAVHLTVDKVNALRDGSARFTEYEAFLKKLIGSYHIVSCNVSRDGTVMVEINRNYNNSKLIEN